ncbi:NAD-dependent epimerase/dehydratase family protein [Anaerolineales bacterium]
MSREKIILITGANGEVGHGLIDYISQKEDYPPIVVLDIRGLDEAITARVQRVIVGDILDTKLLDTLMNEYEIQAIFHLAALLSTHSEFHPEAAHRVNVQGTINLLKLAEEQGRSRGQAVKFIYPSSIASYGMPDLATKNQAGAVVEDVYLNPTTMYGCNKLYCEHLGRYYAEHYQQLSATPSIGVDFRCVRFPGLISATTLPMGGTSDYGPEMLHAAAKGEPYTSFVDAQTQMPFMVMPDAIQALIHLAEAPRESLSRHVYNVSSFSLSAQAFADLVLKAFPDAQIGFDQPDLKRQGIVATWPADMNDQQARHDWGWSPDYDLERAFDHYLIPAIKERYTLS